MVGSGVFRLPPNIAAGNGALAVISGRTLRLIAQFEGLGNASLRLITEPVRRTLLVTR